MAKEEIYFSVDVETDGPIPGTYSMLSFGCVALNQNGKELASFSANLKTLPNAKKDPSTMRFWERNPEAWKICRTNCQQPLDAMWDFVNWVEKICGNEYQPIMVCMPAGFDFIFMYWYMVNFTGKSPFSFSCVDMKTYAMAMRCKPYRQSSKRYWPKRWFSDLPHTHVSIEDAREQGLTFINMMKENYEKNKK